MNIHKLLVIALIVSQSSITFGGESMITQEILNHQKEKDEKTIEALVRNNSNIMKAHSIEHHFYFFTQETAQKLSQEGKELGYQVSRLTEDNHEGSVYWYFDFIKNVVPTIENISQETTLMLNLAHKYDAEYDGWGCNIVE
jgi:regulator of RNase E activity RraB